jgi:TetR/AcrR family transcriptional regulator, transcriptional repressor for nem operon
MYDPAVDSAERLIESTRELLWERGYTGTSPKAIQQRAEAGQGSMYHHFSGKRELAATAIERTAAGLRDRAQAQFSAPGTALQRIDAYLTRERDVLKGCAVGRLTQDPDVMADELLRAPVEETFGWLRGRVAEILAEGLENGEIAPGLDPVSTATAVIATLQGGYVLARAAGSAAVFGEAVDGILGLLSAFAAPAAAAAPQS